MKKIILALSVLGIASLFFACGDSTSADESPNTYSCDINFSIPSLVGNKVNKMHLCGESPNGSAFAIELKEECEEYAQETFPEYSPELQSGAGCVKNAAKVCPMGKVSVYLYDDTASKLTCDDIAEFIDYYFLN